MMKDYNCVGKPEGRLDGIPKVLGRAVFTTDVSLPGMLYGKILRSPHPHAKVISIDTAEALKYPGVKAVATSRNTSQVPFTTAGAMVFTGPQGRPTLDQHIFEDEVRYVGDEVAAIAAETEEAAEEALKLIKVQYEVLPAIYDPLDSVKPDAPDLHWSPFGKNVAGAVIEMKLCRDIEEGFSQCDEIIEETFKLPQIKQVQLETQSAVADFEADGQIRVVSTTQTPHCAQIQLARIFETPVSKVQVKNPPFIGGGFGVRIGLSAKAEPIAAALSKLTGRPVKVTYSRREDFIASDTRHGGYITVKLGARKDGHFIALSVISRLNGGAYCSFGTETCAVMGAMTMSVYSIPFRNYCGTCYYTDRTPAGAMRGFGNPQGMYVVDSAVDMMAEKLGIDPLQLRILNSVKPNDPTWINPYPCTTALIACMEKGAAEIGWKNRGKVNKPDDKKRIGYGMGIGTHGSNSFPASVDYSYAYAALQQDGSLQIATGVPDMGNGTSTTLPQVAAETMGISLNQVGFLFGDTESTPFNIGSHASRTMFSAGSAILDAVKKVRKQVIEYAVPLLESPAENLDIQNSKVFLKDNPDKFMMLPEIAWHAHIRDIQFLATGKSEPANLPPWHAHFAKVEVDMETGMVKVLKMVAAHDCGFAVNPKIVEGQIEGGVLMGIGNALTEELLVDENGVPQNDSIHKYMVAMASDTPEIIPILVNCDSPVGPFGAKGVGECGCIPTLAAVANAVCDATGVRFTELPMTPERVLERIRKAE